MEGSDHEMESRPEIIEIRLACAEKLQIEAEYRQKMTDARKRIAAASRSLKSIGDTAERLRVISYAYENTPANKPGLAWAFFGKENYCWHLRRLMRGPSRVCHKCHLDRPTTYWNFDREPFICESCSTSEHASNERERNLRIQQQAAAEAARVVRIEELKQASRLSDDDLQELIHLLDPLS